VQVSGEKVILGIETSCDDTSVCIMRGTPGAQTPGGSFPKVLSLKLFSQETILKKWGGVVPEIAARNHLQKLAPLIEEALDEAKIEHSEIDAVGVTTHPGLLGPLLTGLNGAKTFCLYHELPLIPVNHLYAHIEAIHLVENVSYPYLGLVVSGGHSLFLLVTSPIDMEILGTTIDDAAGEAFDKGGKLLGLGYPAGKKIDELAKNGDESKYLFPIGLKKSANADLSYSGVKTALRHFLDKNPGIEKDPEELPHVCAGYQRSIVEALKLKARYALKMAREKTGSELPLVIGGGVACNSALRRTMQAAYKNVYTVPPKYCTDNAAMIAHYALRTMGNNLIDFPKCLEVDAKGRFINKNDLQKQAQSK
jgi:N6-L-threonylcarbamoyladenine synthase